MDSLQIIFTVIRLVIGVVCIVGTWMIFSKFGKKGWYAIIPLVCEYKLGECCGKERDGFFMALFSVAFNIVSSAVAFFPENSDEELILSLVSLIMFVPYAVFTIRVYMGLCEAFGKRRLWVILWLLDSTKWICAIYFGINKKIQPKESYLHLNDHASEELSGINVTGNGRDLSVNIRKRSVNNFFSKVTLLRDLHLTIPTGHMVLLLGGSGAGKTTFLNAVTGYEKADADVELGKWNVYRDYNKMKYDVGFVPQQDLMRGSDTVYRTISDAASLRLPKNMKYAEKKARVDEVLEIFGLSALRGNLVSKLSGGQRKRLSIALEYISFPTLFILDEPDSGLDGVVARNLFLKLREIADTGKIVIVITHTPGRVMDLFDDIIVLAKDHARTGRLAFYGPVDEAFGFFGCTTAEEILLAINQKEEGGEGRAEEFVNKFDALLQTAGGEA
ncbi:MAG: ABC transporter ATP-binding protein [Ruminiclostridium sp.]|nr:ABC transporter ATP-binding protein [Ruminiclostridium sp.]